MLTPVQAAIAESGRLLAAGRVLAARELMLKNFDGRNPDAIIAFARTFDPLFVAKAANPDAKPDVDAAVALYSDAARLGAREAEEALKRLRP